LWLVAGQSVGGLTDVSRHFDPLVDSATTKVFTLDDVTAYDSERENA